MNNIFSELSPSFVDVFSKMVYKYGKEMTKLNGLSEDQINNNRFIDNFTLDNNVANSSIDESSNVTHKDILTLISEMKKPNLKLLSLHKIYYEMCKKYGEYAAQEWFENNWTQALYLHDAHTASLFPYCFAHDLKDVAEKGMFFNENLNYQPPKHLETFIDFVKEFISYVSNRSAGACGLPNLVPYMFYFWKKDVDSMENVLKDKTEYGERLKKQEIQRFIYAVNQQYLRDSIQSAFTNVSFFDHFYLMALFGKEKFPDGSNMIDYIEDIMEFQKDFLTEMSRIREDNMFTFPVSTLCLLRDRKHNCFMDEDFAKWACKHNMKWNDSNWFIDETVNSLSNCCRLKNNVEDLGFFNSVGGTALKVGSIKVSTINLARIALESNNDKNKYLEILRKRVKSNLFCLDIVRHIIKRNVEKGLLKTFDLGIFDFKYMYSTIGVIGIFEALSTFNEVVYDDFQNAKYTKEGIDFVKQIFGVINEEKTLFLKDKDYMINIEQIPGESAAVKMQKADKLLFPNTVVDKLPLYGNQFLPLGVKALLDDRLEISSVFDEYCNGGSITHITMDSPFKSFESAWKTLNYIADKKVTYFAFNNRIQACKHNHAFFGKKCPKCGGEVVTEYTRIVGFFTPFTSYSKERGEEVEMREPTEINL